MTAAPTIYVDRSLRDRAGSAALAAFGLLLWLGGLYVYGRCAQVVATWSRTFDVCIWHPIPRPPLIRIGAWVDGNLGAILSAWAVLGVLLVVTAALSRFRYALRLSFWFALACGLFWYAGLFVLFLAGLFSISEFFG